MSKYSKWLKYGSYSPSGCVLIGRGFCRDRELAVSPTSFGRSVTEIGRKAFCGDTELVSVVISEGVTVIGSEAFKGCTKLERVILPDSLERIERGAFEGCVKLGTVVFPDGLECIGQGAFEGCSSLRSVDLHWVEQLGDFAFADCTRLTACIMPYSPKHIGRRVFERSGIFESARLWDGGRLIVDGWLIRCRPEGGTYRVPNRIKGILCDAFDSDGLGGRTAPIKIEFSGTLLEWKMLLRMRCENQAPIRLTTRDALGLTESSVGECSKVYGHLQTEWNGQQLRILEEIRDEKYGKVWNAYLDHVKVYIINGVEVVGDQRVIDELDNKYGRPVWMRDIDI